MNIVRWDFSESGTGKYVCDRTGAIIKRRIRDYIDSGQNVESPEQLYTSILHGGPPLKGVSVNIGATIKRPSKNPPYKIPGINSCSAFIFDDTNIRIYRHYMMGGGKTIKADISNADLPSFRCDDSGGAYVGSANFWFAGSHEDGIIHPTKNAVVTSESESDLDEDSIEKQKIYFCPKEGCTRSFIRFANFR